MRGILLLMLAAACQTAELVVTYPEHSLPGSELALVIPDLIQAVNQPTEVILPAGRITLADALAALATGGPVRVGSGVDLAAVAELSGGAMEFWTAVDQICIAHGLVLLPGEEKPESSAHNAIRVESGPLVLVRDPGPGGLRLRPQGDGAVAVCWYHQRFERGPKGWTAAGLPILRLEPRIPGSWTAQPAEGLNPGFEDGEIHSRGMAALRPVRLTADLELSTPIQISAVLPPGAGVAAPGMTIRLLSPEQRHQTRHGPAVVVDQVDDMVTELELISLVAADVPLERPQADSGWAESRKWTRWSVPAGATVAVTLRARAMVGRNQIKLDGLFLDRTTLPVRARPELAGSVIHWPARSATLGAMVAELSAVAPIGLAFGLDERAERTLPAYSGSWWGAVMLVSQRWNLGWDQPRTAQAESTNGHQAGRLGFIHESSSEPMPPPTSVMLVRGPAASATRVVAGPLLVEVEHLPWRELHDEDGPRRVPVGRIRFRCEPRSEGEILAEPDFDFGDEHWSWKDGWIVLDPWPQAPLPFTLTAAEPWSLTMRGSGSVVPAGDCQILAVSTSTAAGVHWRIMYRPSRGVIQGIATLDPDGGELALEFEGDDDEPVTGWRTLTTAVQPPATAGLRLHGLAHHASGRVLVTLPGQP